MTPEVKPRRVTITHQHKIKMNLQFHARPVFFKYIKYIIPGKVTMIDVPKNAPEINKDVLTYQ
jgi:hypothetical protein